MLRCLGGTHCKQRLSLAQLCKCYRDVRVPSRSFEGRVLRAAYSYTFGCRGVRAGLVGRWSGTASFLAARGCTVGTMALTGRGNSPTDTLTLKALQAGVAAAVDKSGLTPPVIVAHSLAGFVCQQYLQSYSASGLVLLDSFPPSPSKLANEHLKLAQADSPTGHEIKLQGFSKMIKHDPTRWESLLRRYFQGYTKLSPWAGGNVVIPENGAKTRPIAAYLSVAESPENSKLLSDDIRFPVRAFADMCLSSPSASLRLERHVVDTLVLGSEIADSNESLVGGKHFLDVEVAKRSGLDAICNFHGVEGWNKVDAQGRADGVEGPKPWQKLLWDWYDARF